MAKWNPLALKLLMMFVGVLLVAGSGLTLIGAGLLPFDKWFGVTGSIAGVAFGAGIMIAGFDPEANVSWVRAVIFYCVLEVIYEIVNQITTSRFDIVGFDPRGVGGSVPIDCTGNLDSFYALDWAPANAKQRTTSQISVRNFCSRRMTTARSWYTATASRKNPSSASTASASTPAPMRPAGSPVWCSTAPSWMARSRRAAAAAASMPPVSTVTVMIGR